MPCSTGEGGGGAGSVGTRSESNALVGNIVAQRLSSKIGFKQWRSRYNLVAGTRHEQLKVLLEWHRQCSRTRANHRSRVLRCSWGNEAICGARVRQVAEQMGGACRHLATATAQASVDLKTHYVECCSSAARRDSGSICRDRKCGSGPDKTSLPAKTAEMMKASQRHSGQVPGNPVRCP